MPQQLLSRQSIPHAGIVAIFDVISIVVMVINNINEVVYKYNSSLKISLA